MPFKRTPDPDEEEREPRVVKDGESWKLFHKDMWLRKGLEVKRPADIDTVKITDDQKRIIRETWTLMSDHLAESGTLMYLRIFQVSPGIKAVFHMENMTPEEMKDLPRLKMHSVKFMQAIETAVENLDNMTEVVAPIFINLGRRHIYYKDLSDEFFNVFGGALMYTWHTNMGHAFTDEIRGAWSRLFDYMLQHMRFGFIDALAEKHAEEEAEAAAKEAALDAEAAAKEAVMDAEAANGNDDDVDDNVSK